MRFYIPFLLFCTVLIASSFDLNPNNPYLLGKSDAFAIDKKEEGYRIEIIAPEYKDSMCYMGIYVGKNKVHHDTAKFDKKGVAIFEGKKKKNTGMYMIVAGKDYLYDLVINHDQHFSITSTGPKHVETALVKGNTELALFFKNSQYLSQQTLNYKKWNQLSEADTTKEIIALAEAKKDSINTSVLAYQKNLLEQNQDMFFVKLIKQSQPLRLPDGYEDSSKTVQYDYLHNNYWNGFDFQDSSYWHSDLWPKKIMDYVNNYTYQIEDDQVEAIKKVLHGTEGNEEMHRYALRTYFNHFAKLSTKQMCMEKPYLFLADNYYLAGKTPWIDSATLTLIKKNSENLRYNLCNEKSYNLIMQDYHDKEVNLHKLPGEYILVLIWDINCGHCKKVVPVYYKIWEKYKQHGFNVMSIATNKEVDKWKKALSERKLTGWNNCIDPEQKTAYKHAYGVNSTPKVYLLNKNKEIIAKRFSPGQLAEMLDEKLKLELAKEFIEKDKELDEDYLNDDTRE